MVCSTAETVDMNRSFCPPLLWTTGFAVRDSAPSDTSATSTDSSSLVLSLYHALQQSLCGFQVGTSVVLICHSFPVACFADCCDGTDELSGCKNTCIEKNSAKRDTLKKKIDEYKQALDRKAQYAASAAGVRANMKQRFQNVDQDIVNAGQEVQKLSGEVQQLQTGAAVAVWLLHGHWNTNWKVGVGCSK
jgi:hypothetical protein